MEKERERETERPKATGWLCETQPESPRIRAESEEPRLVQRPTKNLLLLHPACWPTNLPMLPHGKSYQINFSLKFIIVFSLKHTIFYFYSNIFCFYYFHLLAIPSGFSLLFSSLSSFPHILRRLFSSLSSSQAACFVTQILSAPKLIFLFVSGSSPPAFLHKNPYA